MNNEQILERAMNFDLDNISYYHGFDEEIIGSFDEFFERYGPESYKWLYSKIDNDEDNDIHAGVTVELQR